MAGAKEIRSKIKSVKNTQKITRAMEKVAMSKMRRAQDRMAAARPYADKIRRTLGHLAQANLEDVLGLPLAQRELRHQLGPGLVRVADDLSLHQHEPVSPVGPEKAVFLAPMAQLQC